MTKQPQVAIIGGGLIGLLTAIELAERGARVTVIEKDDIGFEQSMRSVAAVNLPAGSPNPNPSASLFRVSAERWAAFEERWGCPIDLNDEGWFIVIGDDKDKAWLDIERATWSTTAGYTDSTMLSADEARTQYPQLAGPLVGLDVRHGGRVDAMMVMHGLRGVAMRMGVEIRCGVMATDFDVRGSRIVAIQSDKGRVTCETVIVAAGLWSPDLCARLGFWIPMQRVRAPAAETGPMPVNTIPGFLRAATFGARQNRNGTIRITGGYRFSAMLHDVSFRDLRDLKIWAPRFWQNRKDVALRISPETLRSEVEFMVKRAREHDHVIVPQGFVPPANQGDRRRQLRALGLLIPALRTAQVARYFSGVMDITPDLQPLIGRIPGIENGYVSTGFSGHGYLAGPGACLAIAELVSEGETQVELSAFHPERFANGVTQMRKQMF